MQDLQWPGVDVTYLASSREMEKTLRPAYQPKSEPSSFEEARAVWRRRKRRIWLPVVLVVVMLVSLVAISVHGYQTMRRDALVLSDRVLTNLQSRIETEVEAFLGPIAGAIQLLRRLLADETFLGVQQELGKQLAFGILANNPQLTSLLIGTQKGDFFMMRHIDGDRGATVELKEIRHQQGPGADTVMQFTQYDADGRVSSGSQQPWDGYDPRTRPWYQGGARSKAIYWTDVYPFFTSKAAGITAALPFPGGDRELLAVVGADVELNVLSQFLAGLSISESGIAMIVDDAGRLIAHPETALLRKSGDRLRVASIDDLQDQVVRRAFDLFRVEGHGRHDFTIEDRRFLSSTSSLNHLLQRDWSILVIVPEEDFVGFVSENTEDTLWLGLAVIGLAALLAAFLVRQGLRADRDALSILEQKQQLEAQEEAFGVLASDAACFGTNGSADLASITESMTRAAGVRRASLWSLDEQQLALTCQDCFDRETGGHTDGMVLRRKDHAGLFEKIREVVSMTDEECAAAADLGAFRSHYLANVGCHAWLSAPIAVGERVVGTVWLETEHRAHWPSLTETFTGSIANLLALRHSIAGEAAVGTGKTTVGAGAPRLADTTDAAAMAAATAQSDQVGALAQRRLQVLSDQLMRSPSGADPGVRLVGGVAVMVLRFNDAELLARPGVSEDADGPTFARLVTQIRDLGISHELSELRVFSDQILALGVPGASDQAVRLADFALDVRTLCADRFTALNPDAPLAFAIGIDFGPVLTVVPGDEALPASLVWGDGVRTAMAMAESGLPGTIHVTESYYAEVKDYCLFQLRGHYFVQGVGEFSTYLLGERL